MEYLEHVTSEGERWDTLAWRYYGDPNRYEPIIVANPGVAITPVLPSGIRLAIPLLEVSEAQPAEDLPPWRR